VSPLRKVLNLLPALRSVEVPGNVMGDLEAARLISSFSGLPALENLNLARNGLGEASAGALAAVRPWPTALTRLDLSYNPLPSRAIERIATLVMHLPALKELLLHNVMTCDPGRVLACALMPPPHLTLITLGPRVPVDYDLEQLFLRLPSLESFIATTEPEFMGGTGHAAPLYEPQNRTLPQPLQCTRLRTLDMSAWTLKTPIDDVSRLMALTAVTHLVVPRGKHVETLAEALEIVEHPTAELQHPLLVALASLTQLRALSLRCARLRDVHISRPLLFSPLSVLTELTALNLQHTLVEGASVERYSSEVASLVTLTQLKAVWLAHSNIEDATNEPNTDDMRGVSVALVHWSALELVSVDLTGTEAAINVNELLRLVPLAVSVEVRGDVLAEGYEPPPLTLPQHLTSLALVCIESDHRPPDYISMPLRRLLIEPHPTTLAAFAVQSLDLSGCVCPASFAEHVWSALACLSSLTDLRLTLAFSRAAEWSAAMREHLPALSRLESLAIQGDTYLDSTVGGTHGFPHMALAAVVTRLERLTRLQLWEDTKPDAGFWPAVFMGLPGLQQVKVAVDNWPTSLENNAAMNGVELQ
jgi:Leucine-rich repeat (LRR) protein